MRQELAELKDSVHQRDQRISQVEEYSQTANDAWQGAVARASAAENQARQFETIISSLQEQLHDDQVHKQLTSPERSDIPTAQVAADPIDDHPMENFDDSDTEMNRVNRRFNCYIYFTSTFVRRNCLAMIIVLP